MDNLNIYKDIQARTGGEIYIGVVRPAQTGKSTFIKRFMELLVFPVMEDDNLCNLSRDELPQSAAGKIIMTTEPKFIPKEAAKISLVGGIEVEVRLVGCMGSMAEGVAGHVENGEERLVRTPWFDYDIPLTQAAELGTRKVINGHSTIGIVMTIDSFIGGVKQPGYIVAERQVTDEFKRLGEPFVVLLNSMEPYSDEAAKLTREMSEGYGVSVLPIDCRQLRKDNIFYIPEEVLKKFPVTEMDFYTSKWPEILPVTYRLKAQVIQAAKGVIQKIDHMKDAADELAEQRTDTIRSMNVKNTQMVDGRMAVQMDMDDSYYYQIPGDYVGLFIEGEYQLMQILNSLTDIQREYEKVQNVLTQAWLKGYGVVAPERSETVPDKSRVIKHDNKHGVKMKAEASSINLIKTHTETEIVPIISSEQQAQDLVTYIEESVGESDDGIWNTDTSGKSIG